MSLWASGPMRNIITLPSGQEISLPMPEASCPSQMLSHELPHPSILRAYDTVGKDGLGVYGTTAKGSVPSIGDIRIPVIMVEFSDVPFQEYTTIEKVSRLFNEEGYADVENAAYGIRGYGSVRDYFVQNSDGMFRPTFDVVAKVAVEGKRADYGGNSSSKPGSDKNVRGLVNSAIELARGSGVDFSPYVTDGKGVPLVIIYYAGMGEHQASQADGSDMIWAHYSYNPRTIGGVTFNSYYVGNELFGIYDAAPDYATTGNIILKQTCTSGIGVLIHELMHALGLPDLYDTEKASKTASQIVPTPDYWTVMDYGQYQMNGYRPMQTSAYERSCLGWLTLKEIPTTGQCTIHPHEAYIARNTELSTQYYILETRSADPWYFDTRFGEGMLVWKINYGSSLWSSGKPNNNQATQGVSVFPADGKWQTATIQGFTSAMYNQFRGDLFPGDYKDEAAQIYTTADFYGHKLYNIRRTGDGAVCFDLTPDAIESITTPAQSDNHRVEINPWIYIQNNRKYLKH